MLVRYGDNCSTTQSVTPIKRSVRHNVQCAVRHWFLAMPRLGAVSLTRSSTTALQCRPVTGHLLPASDRLKWPRSHSSLSGSVVMERLATTAFYLSAGVRLDKGDNGLTHDRSCSWCSPALCTVIKHDLIVLRISLCGLKCVVSSVRYPVNISCALW